MSMELGEQEQNVIGALVRLFKNQGEVLLSDEGKLTIPATTLVVVNRAFTTIRNTDDFESSFEATPANTEKLPHLHNVQMLYDFVQKLSRLKVPHHYQSLAGPINLAAFRALRHLEINRLPLHLMNGLAKICGNLETIACTKCVSALKDLFEDCGGDKSSPISWSSLQAVYIRESRILGLDTSLRLVPIVKVLDLSHNSIEDTMNYLEYLTELTMLNLNFNKMYKIPALSVTCKIRLQVLLLRYNRLSHLDGVQELLGLIELDVRGNLIASHDLLRPLKPLTKLYKLYLAENPLCYHRNHRCMTIQHINPMAVRQTLLDGKPFNKKELKYMDSSVPTVYTRPKNHPRITAIENQTDLEQSIERSLTYDASYSATTPTASETEVKVTSIRVAKKKKGSRKVKSIRRARKADISDMDSTTQDNMSVDSFRVNSYVENDSQELRDHIETMRNQLGPDWLQTFEQHKSLTLETAGSDKASQGSMSCRSNSPAQTTADVSRQHVIVEQGGGHENTEAADNQEESNKTTAIPPKSLDLRVDGSSPLLPKSPSKSPSVQIYSVRSQSRPQSSTDTLKTRSSTEPVVWKSESSESNLVDYGAESEPFIVSNYDDPSETYLVSITERYFLEKNIDGVVIEALDLKCLVDVTIYEDSLGTIDENQTEGTAVQCARLQFNYVNRSKRERRIIMEDEVAAGALNDLLRPTVESNQLTAKLRDRLQCLKCGNQFSKHSAKRHVRKSSYGGMSKSSSVGQNMEIMAPLLAEKGTLEEALTCPACSSDKIIEVDTSQMSGGSTTNQPAAHNQPAKAGSQVSPLGSMKANLMPLATSSAQTSPVKTLDGSQRRRQVTAGITVPQGSSAQAVTASSYKSCTTELSTSYKSIKEAVLQANRNKPQVLTQETDSDINAVDIYVEEARDTSEYLHRNDESFQSLKTSERDNNVIGTETSPNSGMFRNEESFKSLSSLNKEPKYENHQNTTEADSSSITVKHSALNNNDVKTWHNQNHPNQSNRWQIENETSGISHLENESKASDTLAWVQRSSEGLSSAPLIKSNSSTGIIHRVSGANLEQVGGSKSNTELRADGDLSQVTDGGSEIDFLSGDYRSRTIHQKSVLRESGSDLLVIRNTDSVSTQQSETNGKSRSKTAQSETNGKSCSKTAQSETNGKSRSKTAQSETNGKSRSKTAQSETTHIEMLKSQSSTAQNKTNQKLHSVVHNETEATRKERYIKEYSSLNQFHQSDSDVEILENPSSQNWKSESETLGNTRTAINSHRISHITNLVSEPCFGQVSLSGQLSRLPGKGGGSYGNGAMTSPSGMTDSESFFSTVSDPDKIGSPNNPFLEDNEDLSNSKNPFFKECEEQDESNPFFEDSNKNGTSNKSSILNHNKTVTSNRTNSIKDNLHKEVKMSSSKDLNVRSGSDIVVNAEINTKATSGVKNKQRTKHVDTTSSALIGKSTQSDNPKTGRIRRQSSDIEVLTEESSSPNQPAVSGNKDEIKTAGISMVDGQVEAGLSPVDGHVEAGLSPVGSLTNRTINDMVDFMRSSIYDASISGQATRDEPASLLSYACEDFSKIDHRLKLYLMMSVFGEGEEFHLMLKCGVIQYTRVEEFTGLLLASNSRVYVFKVGSKENPDHIDKWLKLLHSRPITELQYVDIGLGYQSFRLEMGSEATCFDCIVRDELRCKTFIAQFTALLQGLTFTSQSQLEGITKNNPGSLSNLTEQVFLYSTDSEPLDPVEVDTQVVSFIKGYLHTSKKCHSPVTIAVSNSHVCLASENHRFPPPRCSADKVKGSSEVKGQQFNFKDRQRVTDLTRVELSHSAPCQLTLYFMDESSVDECTWMISMATQHSLTALLTALKSVWTQHFGVDLQIDTEMELG